MATEGGEAREVDIGDAVEFGQKALSAALRSLLQAHHGMFEINVNERAITHVLACCWERNFIKAIEDLKQPEKAWTIDCEYNRMFYKPFPKCLPYNILLEKLQLFQVQREKGKNKAWREHLSQFNEKYFIEIGLAINKAKEEDELPESGGKNVVPDIILHQQTLNTPHNNAIVLEAKPDWGNEKAQLFDLIKLSTFTTPKSEGFPTYQRGIFLHFE